MGDHANAGITPASIQKFADSLYKKLGGTAEEPADLSFKQLQGVANAITTRYRKAGFIVATAFLPAQTIGKDQIIKIRVLEGQVGKVIVEGAKRYYPWILAASANHLKGEALRKNAVDSALLYDRDMPGVSVAATLVPGAKLGQTNVLLIAHDVPHPYHFSVGVNNYGTAYTGLYRVLLGASWDDPLGIGDRLVAMLDYGLDPSQSLYGSLRYSVPIVLVPGVKAFVGATRSTLQINNGPFSALHISGPTLSYYGGMNWKFVNDENLKMQTSLQFIDEQAKISSLGVPLSNEQFDVLDLGFGMDQIDRRFRGINLLQLNLRQSVGGHSLRPDLISPNHANIFTVGQLSFTRLQFLPDSQRIYFKVVGQYTKNILPPLERFSIGGPGSVRAYPISSALTDSGFYTSLRYRVAAPGFRKMKSPFLGERWGSILDFDTFLQYARGYYSAGNQLGTTKTVSFDGVGAGLIFHLARFHDFECRLDYAVPIGLRGASLTRSYQIYSALSMQF
ncbi:ShlB/FhaC/HecB family hemolysin secretion/activation protein [Acidithiobacillus ferrivorans]|uniref:ShlB/FhaC/HecB family hemolysin secretion/activation protein n=1 Tax=Acidithiobacillus ferrivorans TaxID=160808 RepID=UPI001E5CD6EB|nr:ShlB/FhaC/HecB family hemolysin secretion/activation protein [Acidithiobacillus ferrivorans]